MNRPKYKDFAWYSYAFELERYCDELEERCNALEKRCNVLEKAFDISCEILEEGYGDEYADWDYVSSRNVKFSFGYMNFDEWKDFIMKRAMEEVQDGESKK